jgi:hypothetical protein
VKSLKKVIIVLFACVLFSFSLWAQFEPGPTSIEKFDFELIQSTNCYSFIGNIDIVSSNNYDFKIELDGLKLAVDTVDGEEAFGKLENISFVLNKTTNGAPVHTSISFVGNVYSNPFTEVDFNVEDVYLSGNIALFLNVGKGWVGKKGITFETPVLSYKYDLMKYKDMGNTLAFDVELPLSRSTKEIYKRRSQKNKKKDLDGKNICNFIGLTGLKVKVLPDNQKPVIMAKCCLFNNYSKKVTLDNGLFDFFVLSGDNKLKYGEMRIGEVNLDDNIDWIERNFDITLDSNILSNTAVLFPSTQDKHKLLSLIPNGFVIDGVFEEKKLLKSSEYRVKQGISTLSIISTYDVNETIFTVKGTVVNE